MPSDPNGFPEYGEEDVRKVSKALGYEQDVESIMEGWKQLMEVFYQQRWLCIPSMRINEPGQFWSWVLKTYSSDLEEDFPHVFRFIRHILVVPATSSAAERAFRDASNSGVCFGL